MRSAGFLVRFFRVLPPVAPLMNVAFAASAVAAVLALSLHATDAYGVLAPVFLLQALAASSGFAVPARRGHYDLLLTSGVSRLGVGAAHFAASILPGAVCLTVITGLEMVSGDGLPRVTLASGTIVAFVIVSSLSWAVTVPLPRLTGGIVWLLLCAAPLDHRLVPEAMRALALPWTLVGTQIGALGAAPIVTVIAVVVTAVASALMWICRSDISLQVAR